MTSMMLIKIKLLQMIEETNLKTYLGISQTNLKFIYLILKAIDIYMREIKIEMNLFQLI